EIEIDAYTNKKTLQLTKTYNISGHNTSDRTTESLGSYEREEIARRLLSYSTQAGEIVGIALDDFLREVPADDPVHAHLYGSRGNLRDFVDAGYLRLEFRCNRLVIYPTQKLLENQKVPRRRAPKNQMALIVR
ncbi:MAG: hypothetical protein AABX59_01210, partial [Nanoarchaeota archaeon]